MYGNGWRGQFPGVPKTTDGTIPHRLFLLFLGEVQYLQAGREVELMNGVSIGIANAIGGKEDNAVRYAINQLRKRAYPVRYD